MVWAILIVVVELGLRYEAAAVDFWRSVTDEDLGADPVDPTLVPAG